MQVLEASDFDTDPTVAKTAAEFASGRVARLLNGTENLDGTLAEHAEGAWGQTDLGTEGSLPKFAVYDGEIQTNAVYKVTFNYKNEADKADTYVYVNRGGNVTLPAPPETFTEGYAFTINEWDIFTGENITGDAAVDAIQYLPIPVTLTSKVDGQDGTSIVPLQRAEPFQDGHVLL